MLTWTTIRPALLSLFSDLSGLEAVWADSPQPHISPIDQAICKLSVRRVVALGTDDLRTTYDPAGDTAPFEPSDLTPGHVYEVSHAGFDVSYTVEAGDTVASVCASVAALFTAHGVECAADDTHVAFVGVSIAPTLHGMRSVVIECRVESFRQDDDVFAHNAAERARTGLALPSARARLLAANLSLASTVQSATLPMIVDQRATSVASFEATFNAAGQLADAATTWIETCEPEGSYS